MLLGHTEIVHCDKYVSFLKKNNVNAMLFGLRRLECSLAKVILSKLLYDKMKIKVKANGA